MSLDNLEFTGLLQIHGKNADLQKKMPIQGIIVDSRDNSNSLIIMKPRDNTGVTIYHGFTA